jgi:S-(hydroxymethyl)glutathione dehydrogenase/alcohol dehydrogenase
MYFSSIYPYDLEFDMEENTAHTLSRRGLFKKGATAVAGGTFAAQVARGQTSASNGKTMAGTKFRAFIQHGTTASVEELTMLPIQPQQVVVRTQAAQSCYSLVNSLGNAPVKNALTVGHGGIGVVVEVGPMVRRVQVGDRVIVPVTPQCGQCFWCLHERADICRSGTERPVLPIANMKDGAPVFGNRGGFGEFMVPWEEQTVPITTNVSAEELSVLCCVGACGLGLALRRTPVDAGSDVVVFGAGPVGLSAIQGARIAGATQIIAVEPIRYRRELALKLGATMAIDPNVDKGADLVAKIKNLCKGPAARAFAGGRGTNPANWGPLFVLEAVGGDRFPPKVEAGPDPTGVEVLQQAWQVCPTGGTVKTCGVGQPRVSDVMFPAGAWSNAGKTHIPGNIAGVNTLRDMPIFVRLIENKEFDAKSIATQTFTIDRAREAIQVAADRTTVASVLTFA